MHFPLAQRFVPFEIRYPPEWVYDPDAPTPTVELAPVPLASTWAAMEEALPAGLARNIGVCNFNTALAPSRPPELATDAAPLTQSRLCRRCFATCSPRPRSRLRCCRWSSTRTTSSPSWCASRRSTASR
mmetsp:Transcript_20376/g.64879  ORF Transcript_20376/g.64879 Transcript_20376/m.64879 type:complete len:129 (+) Transcript_20376:677-1063(+)